MSITLSGPVPQPAAQRGRGFTTNPRHSGVDYGWLIKDPAGTQRNLAAAAGRVESVVNNGGYNQGWGNRIWVQHTDRAATAYAHAKTGTATVKTGSIVKAGQQLSTMGDTGDSRGVHLHFEVYIDGTRVDPAPYLAGKALPGKPVVSDGSAAGDSRYALRTVKNVPTGKINGRASASRSAEVRQTLSKGTVGHFDQYIKGEKVTQNGVTSDLWFRGAFNHNWFWAGNFTSQATTGMTNAGSATSTSPVGRKLDLRAGWAWYTSAADAKAQRNPHGPKWTGEKLLTGTYTVTAFSQSQYQVKANDGSKVWVNSAAKSKLTS